VSDVLVRPSDTLLAHLQRDQAGRWARLNFCWMKMYCRQRLRVSGKRNRLRRKTKSLTAQYFTEIHGTGISFPTRLAGANDVLQWSKVER
jgi:hypothetical protein